MTGRYAVSQSSLTKATPANILADEDTDKLMQAMRYGKTVGGFTHSFYKYPARFSPLFARVAIDLFSNEGDLVIDPFMGGGTTLVESRIAGRLCVGIDINPLATFVAKVKTSLINSSDIKEIQYWANETYNLMKANNSPVTNDNIKDSPYLANLNSRHTWRFQKLIGIGLDSLNSLTTNTRQRFARCALLSTGQWALDCRKELPTVEQFRCKFRERISSMLEGAARFSRAARQADRMCKSNSLKRTTCLNRSTVGLENESAISKYPCPRLIITSPPYPGVHVLYHRWQIRGRKETPAPYWITDSNDGSGAPNYTFGERRQLGLSKYFDVADKSYRSLRLLCDKGTKVVQLVAFSDPSWQLPTFLDMMQSAGFDVVKLPDSYCDPLEFIQRQVPNRKWYASRKGNIPSSNEILFIHCPR